MYQNDTLRLSAPLHTLKILSENNSALKSVCHVLLTIVRWGQYVNPNKKTSPVNLQTAIRHRDAVDLAAKKGSSSSSKHSLKDICCDI